MTGARVIYAGHNDFGNEVHWLPLSFLQQHWQSLLVLEDSVLSCAAGHRQSCSTKQQVPQDEQHQQHLAEQLDQATNRALSLLAEAAGAAWNPQRPTRFNDQKTNHDVSNKATTTTTTTTSKKSRSFDKAPPLPLWSMADDMARGQAYSALYTTLPVLRVVLMRHPFAWLASRYSWHSFAESGFRCDDIAEATADAGHYNIYRQFLLPNASSSLSSTSSSSSSINDSNLNGNLDAATRLVWRVQGFKAHGWVTRLALDQIYQLCGSDCRARHYRQQATLTELLAQAEANLRQGFAVVGILEQGQELFFEMIAARVQYLRKIAVRSTADSTTTTGAAPNRIHHSTRGKDEECKHKFKHDIQFQQALLEASPEMKGLMHLYNVAVEVNRFQQRELKQCRHRRRRGKV